ncbi:[SSU ribosomal protein S5P]-alanine acetyltransferase [Paraburkholderia sp. BL23I1N1]|uniref:GNAT family N-acetyltransferase n=1 Tax=Paraburkholderia sp. BL23I1N1 TaxID=1938802 RepID=UPI000E760602|nr:GNAT family N-acetyltransferase [Paraburkholderia sp. BL23I1N1]RKE36973.1 [SSU ribosomal protein S5P]-alanine acetyltransferase [Paraburkholderia sp. BL23I1N1]
MAVPTLCLPTEIVHTARLVLRAASERYACDLQAYYLENREHLQPWEPLRPSGFFEADAIAQRLRLMEQHNAAGNALYLLVHRPESGEVIGDCNFTNIVRGPFQACHLGFSIAKQAEGQGLMRESLTFAIEHVFKNLKLHRIMANYQLENTRSARLLERIGFEREGQARSYLKINGSWADHVLTSLLNPEEVE